MSTSSALHCVTCNQVLPHGQEPEYFGQVSVGYKADMEAERAAENVSQLLRYAKTVNMSVWNMLQVAYVSPCDLMDPECYLDEAKSLCTLLEDLVDEAARRVETLSRLVKEKLKEEQANTATQARKEASHGM
jgi:hypothetical protein